MKSYLVEQIHENNMQVAEWQWFDSTIRQAFVTAETNNTSGSGPTFQKYEEARAMSINFDKQTPKYMFPIHSLIESGLLSLGFHTTRNGEYKKIATSANWAMFGRFADYSKVAREEVHKYDEYTEAMFNRSGAKPWAQELERFAQSDETPSAFYKRHWRAHFADEEESTVYNLVSRGNNPPKVASLIDLLGPERIKQIPDNMSDEQVVATFEHQGSEAMTYWAIAALVYATSESAVKSWSSEKQQSLRVLGDAISIAALLDTLNRARLPAEEALKEYEYRCTRAVENIRMSQGRDLFANNRRMLVEEAVVDRSLYLERNAPYRER
jgi:hypothetical protein